MFMYNNGDIVSYGTTGVCRVIGECVQNVKGENKNYIVLKPVYQENSTVYVPVENETLTERIKSLMTGEEINELIREMPGDEPLWADNDSERAELFSNIISGGDRHQLARLVRTLYIHQKKQQEIGRKLHAADEHFFRNAEKLLFEEFAAVLGIGPEDVVDFIEKKLAEENC